MSTIFGSPGDDARCRDFGGGVSVHWWTTNAAVGSPCLCGETLRKPDDVDDEDAP